MGTTLLKKSALIIPSASLAPELADLAEDASAVESRELVVAPAQHGERLDKTLSDGLPEFSRSYLQQLVRDASVTVNGVPVTKPSVRLKADDVCRIALRATPQARAFRPQAMPLEIVFEDAHLLVIDKPAGLVVHPAPGHWSGTLLNGLLALLPESAQLPRAGIVHRLDKDTSGLMLVARTRVAMDALVRMIAVRNVQRQYLALAHRPWTGPAVREVRLAIGRDPANRLRMAALDASRHAAKAASTTLEFLQGGAHGCLVRCTLHSGRTHQIRVHMASIGHPLVADVTYGGAVAVGMQRQALHAFRLALAHPVSGVPLEFLAAAPPDLQAAMAHWGLSYNRA